MLPIGGPRSHQDPRGRPRSEQARQEILEAAYKLLRDKGFNAVGSHEIAQAAGVSTATLFTNQRNLGFAMDGLRFQAIGSSDPTISGRKAAQQIENGVLAGRGPDRAGLHPRTEEMASALRRDRGAMAVPESCDRSALSCRFDSCRLPCSDRSSVGTWQDRVPHVPPHLSCLAGRNRGARGRAAEAYATRARLHHNGPVWKCLGLGKTQSQSANRATLVEKVCTQQISIQ